MADVTIQVVQGLEAGQVLRGLRTPITIGREEENIVQLNDERISRFHAKIQAHADQLILTDLQSTNGTRVNGQFTRLRTIQPGDQIALGRCLLVIGSPEEVAAINPAAAQLPVETYAPDQEEEFIEPFPSGVPKLPDHLNGIQTADLATLLEFIRTETLVILNEVEEEPQNSEEFVSISRVAWHRLQLLAPELARLLNRLIEPPQDPDAPQ